jgi:hypothetical protein
MEMLGKIYSQELRGKYIARNWRGIQPGEGKIYFEGLRKIYSWKREKYIVRSGDQYFQEVGKYIVRNWDK